MSFLQGENITLRALEPDDAVAVWRMECDSDQWLLNGISAPYSLQNIMAYIAGYDADPYRAGQIRLMAVTNGDDDPVGLIDLYEMSAVNHTAYIGVYVSPEYRRRGFAVEMLQLIENYGKAVLKLRSLAARVSSTNMASLNLFEGAGYRLCGTLKDWLLTPDGQNDMSVMQKILL